MDFLNGLEPLHQTLWIIALVSSLFFLIQTIMTFVGMDGSDGLGADFDGDLSGSGEAGFQIFSLRNLVNFLLGFAWTGVSYYNGISNKTVLIFISTLVGLVFVAIFFVIIKQVLKLNEDNSFKIKNTLNKTAEVYFTIPANKTGKGKISISVNGSLQELDAITLGDELKSGSLVKVVSIESDHLLIVEKL